MAKLPVVCGAFGDPKEIVEQFYYMGLSPLVIDLTGAQWGGSWKSGATDFQSPNGQSFYDWILERIENGAADLKKQYLPFNSSVWISTPSLLPFDHKDLASLCNRDTVENWVRNSLASGADFSVLQAVLDFLQNHVYNCGLLLINVPSHGQSEIANLMISLADVYLPNGQPQPSDYFLIKKVAKNLPCYRKCPGWPAKLPVMLVEKDHHELSDVHTKMTLDGTVIESSLSVVEFIKTYRMSTALKQTIVGLCKPGAILADDPEWIDSAFNEL